MKQIEKKDILLVSLDSEWKISADELIKTVDDLRKKHGHKHVDIEFYASDWDKSEATITLRVMEDLTPDEQAQQEKNKLLHDWKVASTRVLNLCNEIENRKRDLPVKESEYELECDKAAQIRRKLIEMGFDVDKHRISM